MSTKNQIKISIFKHNNNAISKQKSKTQKTSPNSILSKALNKQYKKKKNLFGIKTTSSKTSNFHEQQNFQIFHHQKPPNNSLLFTNKIYNNLSPKISPGKITLSSSNTNTNSRIYQNKILKQIPFKPIHKGITTPYSTTKHSRKTSNERNKHHQASSNINNGMTSNNNNKNTFFIYNNNNNNSKVKYITTTNTKHYWNGNYNLTNTHNFTTSSLKHNNNQSTSLNKVKRIKIPNTNDFKNLLSKYSIINHITNPLNYKGKHNPHHKHNTNVMNHFNMSKSYIKQVNQMKLSSSSYYPNKPLLLQQNDLFQNTFNILNNNNNNSNIHSTNTTKQNLKRFYPSQNRNSCNNNNNYNNKDNSGYSIIQNNTSESKGKTISNISSRINSNINSNNNNNDLTKSKDKKNSKHKNIGINMKLTNKYNKKHILHNIDFIFVKYPSYSHTKTKYNKDNININTYINPNYRSYNTNYNYNYNINNNNRKYISTANPSRLSSTSTTKRNKRKSHKSTVKTVLNNLSSPNNILNTRKNTTTSYTNTDIINQCSTIHNGILINNKENKTHTNDNSNNKNELKIFNESVIHSNNNSFCSTLRESNYYNNESKIISDLIINYSKTHNDNEYPKTSIKFYKIGRRIGHGGFGKVNLGLHVLSGHIVAIKSFNKSKEHYSESKVQYEIQLMKKLRGYKNIVKFFEDIHTDKYYCIIMENISGGNLLSLINKRTKLPEKTAKYIFKQLIETLKYIHSQNIAHRDIKPDNILIDLNNTIKICDFGVGKEIKSGQLLYDPCGTPAFVAPEVLGNTPYDLFKTDIWSCGVVLYSMVSGFFPFRGNNDYELHQSILNGEYPTLNDISPELQDLISKILEVDVSKRITLNDILNHSWLVSDTVNITEYEFTNLFTNAEKIIYSKQNVDYRCARKEDLMENFTYKNIISELENENQNNVDKSIVNAPFNTKIRPYLDYEDDVFFEDLNIENTLMKFLPKAQELNLKYEVNYNAEADQGIVKNPRKGNRRVVMSSFNNSLLVLPQNNKQTQKQNDNNDKSGICYNDNNNNNKSIINDHNDNNKETNEIAFDNVCICDNNNNNNIKHTDNDITSSHNNKNKKKNHKDTLSTSSNTFYIDDNALKFVEDFGYKREYILKSLENNETNHATATYYLKLSLLNE